MTNVYEIEGFNKKEQKLFNKFLDDKVHGIPELINSFLDDARNKAKKDKNKLDNGQLKFKAQSYVRNSLRKLVEDDWVEKVDRGQYKLSDTGKKKVKKGVKATSSEFKDQSKRRGRKPKEETNKVDKSDKTKKKAKFKAIKVKKEKKIENKRGPGKPPKHKNLDRPPTKGSGKKRGRPPRSKNIKVVAKTKRGRKPENKGIIELLKAAQGNPELFNNVLEGFISEYLAIKQLIEASLNLFRNSLKDVSEKETLSSEEQKTKPKKYRGRKLKVTKEESANGEDKEEVIVASPAPKKRGRPKKSTLELSAGSTDSVDKDDEEEIVDFDEIIVASPEANILKAVLGLKLKETPKIKKNRKKVIKAKKQKAETVEQAALEFAKSEEKDTDFKEDNDEYEKEVDA